jgi:hypothetical protein
LKIAYQSFNFRPKTAALIQAANQIIAEYTMKGFSLTLRQLYYQFVSRDLIPNTQRDYKNLGSVINDARLAGLIDWSALEDRTRNLRSISHWDSPQAIVDAVARQYAIDKWDNQTTRPEVWIEKDALVGVIERVCNTHDVGFFSCRGYTSQSEMWGAAMRFLQRWQHDGQGVKVIHLGDHDPSGQDMSRDIEERIRMFLRHHSASAERAFQFERIALNRDQIDQYEPPPNPAKSTDARFTSYVAEHGEESWELDALDPQVISDLIDTAILEERDESLWEDKVKQEEQEREQLQLTSGNWSDVVNFVEGL